MLPPFIIDQIREREEKQRKVERVRPTVEAPYPVAPPRESHERDDVDRGVVIIDL